MEDLATLLSKYRSGDIQSLARCITVVENELPGYEELLSSLSFSNPAPVIGFTGPPGAGKSTLINALLTHLTAQGKTVGVIAIDPTSPFNFGSLLGDRLRMAEHFNNPKVFIRSLATRGSLGGLSAKTIEVSDVMRNFGFDYVFIETVGVGQSEVEIAGLADTTVLVLVPGYGDEVQALKSGIMEIGDLYVVNKSDLPGADGFLKTIEQLVHAPVLSVIATENKGIQELVGALKNRASSENKKKQFLLLEKTWRLIGQRRMRDLNKEELRAKLMSASGENEFNIYKFIQKF